jgi:hypothetical protein
VDKPVFVIGPQRIEERKGHDGKMAAMSLDEIPKSFEPFHLLLP